MIPDDPAAYPPGFDPAAVEYQHQFPGEAVRTDVPGATPSLVKRAREMGVPI